MCDLERLDEIQGQLNAIIITLAHKLSDADIDRLNKLVGNQSEVIPADIVESLQLPSIANRRAVFAAMEAIFTLHSRINA